MVKVQRSDVTLTISAEQASKLVSLARTATPGFTEGFQGKGLYEIGQALEASGVQPFDGYCWTTVEVPGVWEKFCKEKSK